jgi:hypothetical protein
MGRGAFLTLSIFLGNQNWLVTQRVFVRTHPEVPLIEQHRRLTAN